MSYVTIKGRPGSKLIRIDCKGDPMEAREARVLAGEIIAAADTIQRGSYREEPEGEDSGEEAPRRPTVVVFGEDAGCLFALFAFFMCGVALIFTCAPSKEELAEKQRRADECFASCAPYVHTWKLGECTCDTTKERR